MSDNNQVRSGVINLMTAKLLPDFKPIFEFSNSLLVLSYRWSELTKSFTENLAPVREVMRRWAEESEKCKNFEDAGWLPHWSSPFDLVDGDKESFDERVKRYYHAEWDALKLRLKESVAVSTSDAEANETFNEALEAHSHGLYRASTRLIFPEIERFVRVSLHDGETGKTITSQHDFIEAIGGLELDQMKPSGVPGFRLYIALAEHAYQKTNGPKGLSHFASTDIPNRHAALHGLIAYSTEKSSLNSIFLFDYIVSVVQLIQNRYVDEADQSTSSSSSSVSAKPSGSLA